MTNDQAAPGSARAQCAAAQAFFEAHRGKRVIETISGRSGTLEACIWTTLHVRTPSGLEFGSKADRLTVAEDHPAGAGD